MASKGLTCSICYFCFDGQNHCPRVLRCGHSFCSFCLERLIRDCNACINCPTCRETVPAGVGDLPKNFELLCLLDTKDATPQHAENIASPICEEIRALASKAMSHVEELKAARERVCKAGFDMDIVREDAVALIQDSAFKLHLHAALTAREKILMDELDEFYKNTANESAEFAGLPSNSFAFLCIKDASHHKCLLQAKAVSKSRHEEMEALALNASTDDEEYEAANARVTAMILDLKEACEEMACEIQGVFIKLHHELAVREQVLIHKLNKLHILKRSNLHMQLERLDIIQASLESINQYATSNIQSLSHAADLLVVRTNIKAMLRDIESQCIVLVPEAEYAPEVTFDELTIWRLYNLDGCELMCAIKSMGAVSDKSTCAETTTAAGFGLQCAPLGYEASFTITAYDAQGFRRGLGDDVFVVELKEKTGKRKVEVYWENNSDGTYLATYTVPADAEPGDYTLSVLFRGTHIKDSPFVVRVGHPSVPANDVEVNRFDGHF